MTEIRPKKRPHRWGLGSDGYPQRNLPKACLRCGTTARWAVGVDGKPLVDQQHRQLVEWTFPDGTTRVDPAGAQVPPCPGPTVPTGA